LNPSNTDLGKGGVEVLFDTVRKALLVGLGVQEKVKEFIDELIKKGELSEAQGAKLLKEWMGKAEESSKSLNKTLSEFVGKTMERMKIPTRDEIDKLSRKIQALSVRVKKLEGGITGEEKGEE
jgi:polyhydroxyalkanoate synthesis regulator phasin